MPREGLPLTETTFYVLLVFLEPSHGYVAMQRIEELSGGGVRIAAGTMYGAVENLLKQGYIVPVKSDDPRRKVYVTTDQGRQILRDECARMEQVAATGRRLLERQGEEE